MMQTRGTKRKGSASSQPSSQPPTTKKTRREDKPATKTKASTKSRLVDSKRRYRHIPEGTGGTYIMKPGMPFIGTDKCYTCLGVYFAIDKHRCFFAHINIEPIPTDEVKVPSLDRTVDDYAIGLAAKRSIVWWVKKNLNDEAWSEDWGPITQLMKESLVVACPSSNSAGKTFVGDAALAGVKEFLGIDDYDPQPMRTEGFVVKHIGGEAEEMALFPVDRGEWEAVEEPVPTGDTGVEGDTAVGDGDRADNVEDNRPPRNWEWASVRKDGQVMVYGEKSGLEGPYHFD